MFHESVFALIPDHEVRAAKLTNRWISGCWRGRDASSDERRGRSMVCLSADQFGRMNNENLADRMDEDNFRRGPATSHQLEPVDDESVRGPNADLIIRASCEGALIDGRPANKVKAGDEREIQQMKDLQLYSWVKETDIPPDKSILLTGWARRMKGSEVRSRCVLKDFATTVRDDVFAPTPSPLSVRGLLLYAALVRSSSGNRRPCVCFHASRHIM